MYRLRAHPPSPALVIAVIALFISLGGGAVAAVELSKDSVGTKQLKNGAVTHSKLRFGAVTASRVRSHSLKAIDFAPGQLPAGPQGPPGPQGSPGPQGQSAPSADVSVRVSVPSQVDQSAGETVTITVNNGGPDATWIGLNNTGSPTLKFIPGALPTTDHGECFAVANSAGITPSRTFTCALGILAAGDSASVTFGSDVCTDNTSTWTDTAQIVSSSFDPAPDDQTASATSSIIPGTGAGC
jgi:hypothetical protein